MSKLVIPGVVASAGNGGGGGGTGDYVQVITTSQFIMDPSQSVPIPVVDDIKDTGSYSIILDLSVLMPGIGMVYSLSVDNQDFPIQILEVDGTGVTFRRIFESNTWSEWENVGDLIAQGFLQEIEGYDNTKTQVLKNSTGTLQWSEDSGGGTVDQTYDSTSTNAQSGTAVAGALTPYLKNLATGVGSLSILGNAISNVYSLSIGDNSSVISTQSIAIGAAASVAYGADRSVAIGMNSSVTKENGIAIGRATKVSANNAIQLGANGSALTENTHAKTLQVFEWQLLDGNTGKIPAERLPSIGGAPTITWYKGNTGTTITIADTTNATLVKVYKNGLLLEPSVEDNGESNQEINDYSISGTTLTLTTALVSTDKIAVEVF